MLYFLLSNVSHANMKQPKEHLYSLLTTNTTIVSFVADRVYFQSNDEEQNKREDRFPAITFFRIMSHPPNKTTKRTDVFQITSRASTNQVADTLAEHIIKLLHHRTDTFMKNCFLRSSRVDLYDRSCKVHGIAMTFHIVMEETDY